MQREGKIKLYGLLCMSPSLVKLLVYLQLDKEKKTHKIWVEFGKVYVQKIYVQGNAKGIGLV